MHSKAIEAGALAIFREQLLLDDDECRQAAQAAVQAYLATMEAEGLAIVPVEVSEAHQTRAAALDTLLAIDGPLYDAAPRGEEG